MEKVDGEALAVEADVTRSADVERYAEAAIERFGAIDVFFNNAGVLGAREAAGRLSGRDVRPRDRAST